LPAFAVVSTTGAAGGFGNPVGPSNESVWRVATQPANSSGVLTIT
jgi:hypothetical protein